MLHYDKAKIKELLFTGEFGLEKETLRVTEDGHFAHTPHPFLDDKHIVRDFCENQLEINTGVSRSAEEAISELNKHENRVKDYLKTLETPEYLWPYSNPPYIVDENDIPVAIFTGEMSDKTRYRDYLSQIYGKYKMTFCGIHVNYSFSEELLQADWQLSEIKDYGTYKNRLYLKLARNLTSYGWIITALLSASPILDSSFLGSHEGGKSEFLGMSSVRCSELGYWNHFVPIFDYTNVESYVNSIRGLIDEGLISSQTEIYYPVRLKCRGENNLDTLLEHGVNHIEIRNVDLNPLSPEGLDLRDLEFIQILLIYCICIPEIRLDKRSQVNAVTNYKNAAHYDIENTKIMLPDKSVVSVQEAGIKVLNDIEEFLHSIGVDRSDIINFERDKFINPENSYGRIIKEKYEKEYVSKMLGEITKS